MVGAHVCLLACMIPLQLLLWLALQDVTSLGVVPDGWPSSCMLAEARLGTPPGTDLRYKVNYAYDFAIL